jgi:hypothetical protein
MMMEAFRAAAVGASGPAAAIGPGVPHGTADASAGATPWVVTALPQPLQVRILAYLDLRSLLRAREVCKSWKVLVTSPALTYRLDVSTVHKRVTDPVLRAIAATYGSHVGVLSLRSCWLVSDAGVRDLLASTPHLEVGLSTFCEEACVHSV